MINGFYYAFANNGESVTYPVMTFWTSLSFILSIFYLDTKSERVKNGIFYSLLILQVFSLGSGFSKELIHSPYFLPSSLPSIFFFLSFLLHRKLKVNNLFKNRYFSFYFLFFLASIPLLGLLRSFLSEPAIINQNPNIPALGLSLPTSIVGLFLVIICASRLDTEEHLNIKAFILSLEVFYTQLASALVLSFFIEKFYHLGFYLSLFIGLSVTIFLFYFVSLKKIKERMDKDLITICAEDKTIKPQNSESSEWIPFDEFLKRKGFNVSHGFSPHATKKKKVDHVLGKLESSKSNADK